MQLAKDHLCYCTSPYIFPLENIKYQNFGRFFDKIFKYVQKGQKNCCNIAKTFANFNTNGLFAVISLCVYLSLRLFRSIWKNHKMWRRGGHLKGSPVRALTLDYLKGGA